MITLVTYHPASLLYRGSTDKGLSKEGIVRALREDILRVKSLLDNKPTSNTNTSRVNTLVGLDTTVLGIDTEFSPKKELLTIGLSTDREITTWDKDLEGMDPAKELAGVQTLVLHGSAEDITLPWEKGWLPRDVGFLDGTRVIDSLLLSRMVYEGQASYKLEDLVASLLTVDPWKHKTSSKGVETWTPEERVERCGMDAWGAKQLVTHQWDKLSSLDQHQLYPFTTAIMLTLHRLSLAGAYVDIQDFDTLVEQKRGERGSLGARLINAGVALGIGDYSPTNDDQTREILYEKLGLPVLKQTAKSEEPAVDKDTLEALTAEAPPGTKGFLETLLEFKKVNKLLSTYLTGPEDPDKRKKAKNALGLLATRVHVRGAGELLWLPFHFHTLGAKTARRSSSNPNSQNWPPGVRRLVRSRWKDGRILAADYRKLEPVIIAWLAQDSRLLEFFTTGGGYIDIARELFNTVVEEGTLLYRGVKSIVLGVHYDMGTDEMARQLWVQKKIKLNEDWGLHYAETDRIRNLYLTRFPSIQAYMDRRRAEARATGRVTTPTGRVRRVGNQFIDKHILNQAINAPVQSTASDVTGSALLDCERAICNETRLSLLEWYDILIANRRRCLTSQPGDGIILDVVRIPHIFNEVHDEVTVDLPPEWVKNGTELIIETMRAVPTLRALAPYLKDMPLYVDPKIGPRWGEKG